MHWLWALGKSLFPATFSPCVGNGGPSEPPSSSGERGVASGGQEVRGLHTVAVASEVRPVRLAGPRAFAAAEADLSASRVGGWPQASGLAAVWGGRGH